MRAGWGGGWAGLGCGGLGAGSGCGAEILGRGSGFYLAAVPGPAALTPFPLPSLRLSQYDAACQLAQEVAERIQERSRHRRNGESSAKVRRGARLGLGALLSGGAVIGGDGLCAASCCHRVAFWK